MCSTKIMCIETHQERICYTFTAIFHSRFTRNDLRQLQSICTLLWPVWALRENVAYLYACIIFTVRIQPKICVITLKYTLMSALRPQCIFSIRTISLTSHNVMGCPHIQYTPHCIFSGIYIR